MYSYVSNESKRRGDRINDLMYERHLIRRSIIGKINVTNIIDIINDGENTCNIITDDEQMANYLSQRKCSRYKNSPDPEIKTRLFGGGRK